MISQDWRTLGRKDVIPEHVQRQVASAHVHCVLRCARAYLQVCVKTGNWGDREQSAARIGSAMYAQRAFLCVFEEPQRSVSMLFCEPWAFDGHPTKTRCQSVGRQR